MAKTMKELNNIKQELETLANKFQELTEDEPKVVTGGVMYDPFEKLEGRINQDVPTPRHKLIDINGLETIRPYAVGGIPLDSDSKIK